MDTRKRTRIEAEGPEPMDIDTRYKRKAQDLEPFVFTPMEVDHTPFVFTTIPMDIDAKPFVFFHMPALIRS